MDIFEAIFIWMFIGIVSYILETFVYFDGPEHMIKCYQSHKNPKYKTIGNQLEGAYILTPYLFVIVGAIVSSLLGVISVLAFIKTFIQFTFLNK